MEHGYTHKVTRLADWSKGRNLFTLIGGQSVPIRGLRIRDLENRVRRHGQPKIGSIFN